MFLLLHIPINDKAAYFFRFYGLLPEHKEFSAGKLVIVAPFLRFGFRLNVFPFDVHMAEQCAYRLLRTWNQLTSLKFSTLTYSAGIISRCSVRSLQPGANVCLAKPVQLGMRCSRFTSLMLGVGENV